MNKYMPTEAAMLRPFAHLSLCTMNTSRFSFLAALLVLLTFSLSSCDAIGTIFKAGAWTALIGVFVVVLLLWLIVSRFRRR